MSTTTVERGDHLARLPTRTMLACVLATSVANAQAATSADVAGSDTFFKPHDAVVAAAFLGASAALSILDARIARSFQDTSHVHVRLGQKVDQAFSRINETTLTAGGLVLYALGRATRLETMSEVSLHVAESVAAASITAQAIRGPLGRTRPLAAAHQFEDQYEFHFFQGFTHFAQRSFPSIHSSSGFAAASTLVAEVKWRAPRATWFVGVPAYAMALTPGLARMYLGQHWASDVFSGAFLGTFYGWRVAGYSHTHRRTPVDRVFLGSAERIGVQWSF